MVTPRRPDPAPLETDDVSIVTAGTAVWALALVGTVAWRGALADHGHDSWVWVCAAGVFLGLVGLRHVRRRGDADRSDRRVGADAADPAAAPREPLS